MTLLVLVGFLALLGAFAAYLSLAGPREALPALGTWRQLATAAADEETTAAASARLRELQGEAAAGEESLRSELAALRAEVAELRAQLAAPPSAAGSAGRRRTGRKAA